MSGKYVYTHDNVSYYHLPIEAWQGLLDDPARVFELCEGIMIVDCKDNEELKAIYGFNENAESFKKKKQLGLGFFERNRQSRVSFSIQVEMYCQYKSDFKSGRIKEWDWLLLLWWMALHTIGGGVTIKDTNNEFVFLRAAGFASNQDYRNHEHKSNGKIMRYLGNPARYAARIREELMLKFDGFHAYSMKGRRGWCFMFAMMNRQDAFDMLARHMAERGTKGQRKKELAQMMKAAKMHSEKNRNKQKELLDGQSGSPESLPRNSNNSISAAKIINNFDNP